MRTVHINCDTCVARGPRCSECVLSVILDAPSPARLSFDADEQAALRVLADSGLVPRLEFDNKLKAV